MSMIKLPPLELSKPDTDANSRKRRSAPKTRTGCLTCRKRRIKCDEHRPKCIRCTSRGWVCDGYVTGISSRRVQNRPILPLSDTVQEQVLQSSRTVQTQPFAPRFADGEEYQYFRHFKETASYYLDGRYDPALWERIVLQASENEPAIRHAVIAIGALDLMHPRSEVTAVGTQGRTKRFADSAEARHIFALRQYSLAIKGMQEKASVRKQTLRTTLTSSLLFICFEIFHGNYESATRQIHIAVKSLDEATQAAEHDLRESEDKELIQMFDRLDIQSFTHHDPYSLEDHMRMRNTASHVISQMPSRFSDIKEARSYFHVMLRRTAHFAAMIRMLGQQTEDASDGLRNVSFMDLDRGAQMTPAILLDAKQYMQENARWNAAFAPVEEARSSMTQTDLFLSAILRINYIIMQIILTKKTQEGECFYDTHYGQYKEMVRLCRTALMNDDASIFKFNLGTIFALDMVAKKCRDPELRRAAIYLLVFQPRREGLWDSLLAANVCTWVMEVEEEGMVNGYVPEESRLRNVGVRIDMENQKTHVWAQQWKKDSIPRKLVRIEKVITW